TRSLSYGRAVPASRDGSCLRLIQYWLIYRSNGLIKPVAVVCPVENTDSHLGERNPLPVCLGPPIACTPADFEIFCEANRANVPLLVIDFRVALYQLLGDRTSLLNHPQQRHRTRLIVSKQVAPFGRGLENRMRPADNFETRWRRCVL